VFERFMQNQSHAVVGVNSHVAMKKPPAWIVGSELQHYPTTSREVHRVFQRGDRRIQQVGPAIAGYPMMILAVTSQDAACLVVLRPTLRKHSKLVSMKVHRMCRAVLMLDNDAHCFTERHTHRQCISMLTFFSASCMGIGHMWTVELDILASKLIIAKSVASLTKVQ